jgi:hypothetical protein
VEPVFTAPAVEPIRTTPALEPAEVPQAAAATAPPDKNLLSQAVANEQAFSQAFKTSLMQVGWSLVLQGVILAGFCALVKGGTPLHGLPLFLTGLIPLIAMGLLVAAFMSFQAAQQVLDNLEADRRRCHRLLAVQDGTPDALTSQRKLAAWPVQAVFGVLFVIWLFTGLTVWFL